METKTCCLFLTLVVFNVLRSTSGDELSKITEALAWITPGTTIGALNYTKNGTDVFQCDSNPSKKLNGKSEKGKDVIIPQNYSLTFPSSKLKHYVVLHSNHSNDSTHFQALRAYVRDSTVEFDSYGSDDEHTKTFANALAYPASFVLDPAAGAGRGLMYSGGYYGGGFNYGQRQVIIVQQQPAATAVYRPGAAVAGARPGGAVAGAAPGVAVAGARPGVAVAGAAPGAAVAGAAPGVAVAGARPGVAAAPPGPAVAAARPGGAPVAGGAPAGAPGGVAATPGASSGAASQDAPDSGAESPDAGADQGSQPSASAQPEESSEPDPKISADAIKRLQEILKKKREKETKKTYGITKEEYEKEKQEEEEERQRLEKLKAASSPEGGNGGSGGQADQGQGGGQDQGQGGGSYQGGGGQSDQGQGGGSYQGGGGGGGGGGSYQGGEGAGGSYQGGGGGGSYQGGGQSDQGQGGGQYQGQGGGQGGMYEEYRGDSSNNDTRRDENFSSRRGGRPPGFEQYSDDEYIIKERNFTETITRTRSEYEVIRRKNVKQNVDDINTRSGDVFGGQGRALGVSSSANAGFLWFGPCEASTDERNIEKVDGLVDFLLSTLKTNCISQLKKHTASLFTKGLVKKNKGMELVLETSNALFQKKALGKDEWDDFISALFLVAYSNSYDKVEKSKDDTISFTVQTLKELVKTVLEQNKTVIQYHLVKTSNILNKIIMEELSSNDDVTKELKSSCKDECPKKLKLVNTERDELTKLQKTILQPF